MKDKDWHDEVYSRQPCSKLGTILSYIAHKHGITRGDLYLFLELNEVGEFTTVDFATAKITLSWSKKKFYNEYKKNGWIELYRERGGKFKRYNLYKLAPKSKRIVTEFYKLISGEKPLPNEAWNKKWSYTRVRTRRKIKDMREREQFNS